MLAISRELLRVATPLGDDRRVGSFRVQPRWVTSVSARFPLNRVEEMCDGPASAGSVRATPASEVCSWTLTVSADRQTIRSSRRMIGVAVQSGGNGGEITPPRSPRGGGVVSRVYGFRLLTHVPPSLLLTHGGKSRCERPVGPEGNGGSFRGPPKPPGPAQR